MTEEAQPILSMSAQAKADAYKETLERAKRAESQLGETERLLAVRTTECEALLERVFTAERRLDENLIEANATMDTLDSLRSAGIDTDDPAAGVRELAAQRDEARETEALRLAACSFAALDPSQLLNMAPEYDSAARRDVSRMRMELDAARRLLEAGLGDRPPSDKAPAPEPPTASLYCRGCEYGGCHLHPRESAEAEPSAPERTNCMACGGSGVQSDALTGDTWDCICRKPRPRTPETAEPAPTRDEPRIGVRTFAVSVRCLRVSKHCRGVADGLRCDKPRHHDGSHRSGLAAWNADTGIDGPHDEVLVDLAALDLAAAQETIRRLEARVEAQRTTIEQYQGDIRLLEGHRALCVKALRKVQERAAEAGHGSTFDIVTDVFRVLDESADGGGL